MPFNSRSRSPITGAQYALAVSTAAVTLIVPSGAGAAEIYVRTNAVVFTRDGTTPTATKGIQANAGDIIVLASLAECQQAKFIRASADATMDVEYFTEGA